MPSEKVRSCGYRKVGGLYLCGEGIWVECDRLPYELKACPVCGGGIHFTRSMTKIDPLELFGKHQEIIPATDNPDILANKWACECSIGCKMCDPTSEAAYIRTIGKKFYSPVSFLEEARELGLSLRMAQIPKALKLGVTVVYLLHPEAVYTTATTKEQEEMGKFAMPRLGIFAAFIPKRIEMPVWEHQLTDSVFMAKLSNRRIIPIVVEGEEHKPVKKT